MRSLKYSITRWLRPAVMVALLLPVFAGRSETANLSPADATDIVGEAGKNTISESGDEWGNVIRTGGVSSFSIGDFSFAMSFGDEAKNAPTIWDSKSVRLYSGSTISITAPEGWNIESIEFTDFNTTSVILSSGSSTDGEFQVSEIKSEDGTVKTATSFVATQPANTVCFSWSGKTFSIYQMLVTYSASGTVVTVPAPVFSPASGTSFLKTLTVEISATEGHSIYFTTDGTNPEINESMLYKAPLVLSSTKTVKAIAVDADGNKSRVVSATYPCSYHGIGEDYDPSNPAEPGDETPMVNVYLVSNPDGAGSFNYSSPFRATPGETVYIDAYGENNWEFVNYTIDGTTVDNTDEYSYISYIVPENGGTIVANFVYNPSSPNEPEPGEVYHPIVLRSSPSNSATFNYNATDRMRENTTRQIYAYPSDNFEIVGWTVNGVDQNTNSRYINVTMGEKGLDVCVYTRYNPASPANPGANYYNAATGQLIVDDFQAGSLWDVISNLVTDQNYANVSHVVVKGVMNSNDWYGIMQLTNAGTIDISRTSGLSYVPSTSAYSMAASTFILPSTITSVNGASFAGFPALQSLVIYAMEPPTVSYGTSFEGMPEGCIVYTLGDQIPLYQEADVWKNYVIMPINNDAHVMQVNLPADGADGRYRNNTIQIVNTNTGVRQKYVVTDRMLYTFNGLQKDEQYVVYMFSQSGMKMGTIEGIIVPDSDFEVTFSELKALHTVKASVKAGADDVTGRVSVEWLQPAEDGTLTFLRKATEVPDVPDGQQLVCRVTLPEELGRVYTNPGNTTIDVSADNSAVEIELAPIAKLTFAGTVTDTDGKVIKDAKVAIVQDLNGKYTNTVNVTTGRDGKFSAEAYKANGTRLVYSANEFVTRIDTIPEITADVTLALDPVQLRSLVGARINYNFSYLAAGSEAAGRFDDYENVTFTVKNVTQDRMQNDLTAQYPMLVVLDETVQPGDSLLITATSRKGAFKPIERGLKLDDNRKGEVVFDIIGKGGINARFSMTDSPAVTGMLYDGNGRLTARAEYSEAALSFRNLEDGDYTLVSMTKSDLLNGISTLDGYAEIGLKDGKDYLASKATVKTGSITEINIEEVPTVDESLFTFTNAEKTTFATNRSDCATGNYITISTKTDFKTAYKDRVKNATIVVTLPDNCDMVEQSLIQGANAVPYTNDNGRITITADNLAALMRFCVMPLSGGELNLAATVNFELDGKPVSQPIGTATVKVKDVEISVPGLTASETFPASGFAFADSKVNVYDDTELIGTTKVNSKGTWKALCTLANPKNLSSHNIHAEIITPKGNKLMTETRIVEFDHEAVMVSKVVMHHWNPELNHEFISEFDFRNPKSSSSQWTVYYPKKVFTYTIDFTANDPERIHDVVLYIHTADNNVVPVNAEYNEKNGNWFASIDMGSSSNGYYPVNCSVDFTFDSEVMVDAEEFNSNINAEDIMGREFAEDIAETEALAAAASALLDDENVTAEDIATATDPVLAALGLTPRDNFDGFDAEYVVTLAERLEKMLADEKFNFEDKVFTQSLDEINAAMDGITIADCSAYDESKMEELGYTVIKRNDDSMIYILADESSMTMVDFANGKSIVIMATPEEQARMRRANGNDVSAIQEYCDRVKDACDKFILLMGSLCDAIETAEDLLVNLLAEAGDDIEDAQAMMKYLKSQPVVDMDEYRRYKKLFDQGVKKVNWMSKLQAWLDKSISTDGLRVGKFAGAGFAAFDIVKVSAEMVGTLNDVINLYYTIPDPCPDDQSKATNLQGRVKNHGIACGVYYVAQITMDAASLATAIAGVAGLIPSGGTSTASLAASLAIIATNVVASIAYDKIATKNIEKLKREISKLKCHKDKKCGEEGMPPCPNGGNGGNGSNGPNGGNGGKTGQGGQGGDYKSNNPSDDVAIDPSGYVYEGVPTNRLEGVQATIYYKETKEDMYGDPYEEEILWNAEEYAQENPLFTDENGMYRWDVPQGLWQVRFEKDGYVATRSAWLPVPPPQLDVNIPMVQNKQPEVTEARAYEGGVEVQFDKYMQPESLNTSNIFVTANGSKVAGEVTLVDTEVADPYLTEDGIDENTTRYASRVRFVPEQPLSTSAGEVRITVSRNVLSYAGIPMTQTFTQVLDIEKEVEMITADDVKVLYGGTKEITVFATPFDAAAGRTLRVKSASELIATLDATEAVLDEEGKATFTITGELPGTTDLIYEIDNVTVTGSSEVDVVTKIVTAEKPTASRASGTAVYRGTKVSLATDSEDGVIWFTTDGSCPCDENGTRRKYTVPIEINGDVTINAMTAVGTGDDDMSETVTFNYSVKKNNVDINLAEGWNWISHNVYDAVEPAAIAAEGNVELIRSLDQETVNDPQYGFIGTLRELTADQGYKVKATAASAPVRISDDARDPSAPIAIAKGWNWIGYPSSQTMSVEEAFATTEVEELDIVAGIEGFAQYNGTTWEGSLLNLVPGRGYLYQSQSDKRIVYNNAIVSNAASANAAGITRQLPVAVDCNKYADAMYVVAELEDADGTLRTGDELTLVAFCGTECRGIAKSDGDKSFVNVYGNDGDELTFCAIDAEGKMFATTLDETFAVKTVGSVNAPVRVKVSGTSGIDPEWLEGDLRVVVQGKQLIIKGIDPELIDTVEMFSTEGAKKLSVSEPKSSIISAERLDAGTYVVVVKAGASYSYHKVLIK